MMSQNHRQKIFAVPPAPTFSRGFTLTEMAVVLVIVALLIGGMIMPMSAQQDIRYVNETQATLKNIEEALLGFAVANGYLPCPAPTDLSTNGLEAGRDANGACSAGIRYGLIPWASLGIGRLDAWGHRIRYSVSPAFSNSNTGTGIKFTLSTPGDITIQTRDTAGNLQTLALNVPAALVSHGARAAHAYSETGVLIADSPNTNTDEDTNGTGIGTTFVNRTPSPTGSGGEFDDIVIWLPTSILANRMISAGKLP